MVYNDSCTVVYGGYSEHFNNLQWKRRKEVVMIELTGMISIPYLKKTTFTGSEKGTNFMIRKISGEEES